MAYTFTGVDYDNPEMMAAHTAATLELIGHPEDKIDDRSYFRPFRPSPSNNNAPKPNTEAPEPSTDAPAPENEEEEHEYDNSQGQLRD